MWNMLSRDTDGIFKRLKLDFCRSKLQYVRFKKKNPILNGINGNLEIEDRIMILQI